MIAGMKWFCFWALLPLAVFGTPDVAEPIVSAYSCSRPRTDGVITKDEYRFAATFRGAANYRQAAATHNPAKPGPRKAECAVTWDEDALYVAVRSETKEGGVLPAGGPQDPLWTTDSYSLTSFSGSRGSINIPGGTILTVVVPLK